MQVLFNARDRDAEAMRPGVERRVRFVLRRDSWRLPRAHVRFSDVNGPRGGVDKCCRIELHTDGAGPVVVTSVRADWRAALDDALARAARFVRRLWQRLADRRPRRRALERGG